MKNKKINYLFHVLWTRHADTKDLLAFNLRFRQMCGYSLQWRILLEWVLHFAKMFIFLFLFQKMSRLLDNNVFINISQNASIFKYNVWIMMFTFEAITPIHLDFLLISVSQAPVGTRGFKSRICPQYPHACRKRRLRHGPFDISGGGAGTYVWARKFFSDNIGERLFFSPALWAGLFF